MPRKRKAQKRKAPKRKTPKAVLITAAILTGIVCSALALTAAELAARRWGTLPNPHAKARISESVEEAAKRLASGAAPPTHVAVHLPPPLHEWRPGPPSKPFGANYGNSLDTDPEVGFIPHPGFHGRVYQTASDGTINYDAIYTNDAQGRRVVPGQESGKRSHVLLFLGDSFTYGVGLQDDQTIPAQAARLATDYRVYNYGIPGAGPNNLLRWVHKKGFAQDVPRSPGTKAIYLFIDHHLNRILGSLDLERAAPGWVNSLPNYELDSEGRLQTAGMIADAHPWRNFVYRLLAQSRLLTDFQVELPPSFTEQHYRLFTAIVADLRDTLRSEFPGLEFYVAFFPGSATAATLIPYLDQKGINSLDYTKLDLARYVDGPVRLPDGHTTAASDRFLARQFLSDLGLIAR